MLHCKGVLMRRAPHGCAPQGLLCSRIPLPPSNIRRAHMSLQREKRVFPIVARAGGGGYRPRPPGGNRKRAPQRRAGPKRIAPINEEIRFPQVRVLDSDKTMLGVMNTEQALSQARAKDVDLVMVSKTADPPLCRLIEYSKFKYETEKSEREARKKQRAARVDTKELKMRPTTDVHDYQVRVRKAVAEIGKGNHVKVVVAFKGREFQFKDQGRELLNRFITDLGEQALVERGVRMEGRNMTVIVKPNK